MNQKITLTASAICCILLLLVYISPFENKTSFIYISTVFENYKRMQEVEDRLRFEGEELNQELLSAYEKMESYLSVLKQKEIKLSPSDRLTIQNSLDSLNEYVNYREHMNRLRVDSLRQAMVSPVVEEINSYVEQYGKKHDLDYILGNVGSGNIMYGNIEKDITTDIVDGLNEQYDELVTGKK